VGEAVNPRHAARRSPAGVRAWAAALVAAAALLAAAGSVAGASPASSGSVAFGEPAAVATFGTGVSFSQPVTAPGVTATAVDLLVRRPGSPRLDVYEAGGRADIGTQTLHFDLAEATHHIYPNTRLTAQWRIRERTGTVALGPAVSVTYTDTRFAWQTASGSLVRVHWYVGDAAFGRRALAIAEAGIAKAEALFGVTETEPVDFFVYADQQAFYDILGPGTRENVGGEAHPDLRTLYALITPDVINAPWVGTVIPHELTHLVFDTAVGNPFHSPPPWFNEGLAVYLSQGYDSTDRGLVRDAVAGRQLIPLTALGQFPTQRERFSLAYAESASAIDYLVRSRGRSTLQHLIALYATGVTDDEAFQGALGVTVVAFGDGWLADLGATAPVPLGPRPDPSGPVPSAWNAPPGSSPAIPPATAASSLPATSATPVSTAPGSLVAPSMPPSDSPAPAASATPASSLASPTGTAGSPGSPAPDGGLAILFGLIALLLGGSAVVLLVARRRSGTVE
jgi:hypothetical protein